MRARSTSITDRKLRTSARERRGDECVRLAIAEVKVDDEA